MIDTKARSAPFLTIGVDGCVRLAVAGLLAILPILLCSIARCEDTFVPDNDPLKTETRGPATPVPDSENDQDFFYGAEVDINSAYVWRGIELTNKPVFQPSVWVGIAGFTFLVEDNDVLATLPEERAHLHSTDLTLTYTKTWKKLKIEPGFAAYLNRPPGGERDPKTGEALLKVSYPIGPLQVFTENAYDVVTYAGAYFGEGGLAYVRNVKRKALVEITAHSGWASQRFNLVYIGVNKSELNYLGFDAAVTFHPTGYLYIRPHMEFSDVVAQQLRTHLPWPTAVNVGLSVGVDF